MIQDAFGNKRWYKEGMRHREGGPAVEYSNGAKLWYKEGKLHREDGPAIEHADGRKEYWKNNKALTKKELNEIGLFYSKCKRCKKVYLGKSI